MNLLKFATISAAMAAASVSYGQSATLTADTSVVSAGAAVTLTAAVSYPGTPSAVGWSVTLPDGWTFVSTSGPNPPQVGPQEGATGTLEWAFSDVPANGARFSVSVKAAGKPGAVRLPATVFLRVDGKQQAVEVAPVSVSVFP